MQNNLTQNQIRQLRQKAHKLKPVVSMGKSGLSQTVLAEIEQALAYHELIKIKLAGVERDNKTSVAEAIESATDATRVQIVGNILSIYRPPRGRKAKIILS